MPQQWGGCHCADTGQVPGQAENGAGEPRWVHKATGKMGREFL